MKRKQPGSVALSVLLTFLIVLSGTYFVNAAIARDALSPKNIREEMIDAGLTNKVVTQLKGLESISSELATAAQQVVESTEYNELVDQYAAYISDYLLTGSTSKALSNQELANFLSSYLKKQLGSGVAEGEMLDRVLESVFEKLDLSSVFTQADQMIPEPAGTLVHLALNNVTFYVGLGITVILLVLLLFAARPRRFAGFAGAGSLLIGGCTVLLSGMGAEIILDLAGGNQTVSHLLAKYGEMAFPAGCILAAAGAVLLVAGLIVAALTRRRSRYW